MSSRFTISLHRVATVGYVRSDVDRDAAANSPVGDHLDWFFEVTPHPGSLLTTFASPPACDGAPVIHAVRLVDHRVRYLDHDGELSGNRGCVQRLVTGRCHLVSDNESRFVFRPVSFEFLHAMSVESAEDNLDPIRERLRRVLAPLDEIEIRT
ncbi:hypothetical protein [Aporhodopirellula aestuarii]|uniref:Uncharacterized protein n=1 Tax=Aporhodopirellula aestuarii TaxID=2950107 RepID=A0ABT0U3Z6_9BACT|nr:hypothetical protein [Aporhodopirellula aestuarii]MCM2371644.1 hypothetical protein [Aporhodopirellula aestuarii]